MKTTAFPNDLDNRNEFAERRYKKDWVARSVSIIAVVGWISALVSLTLIDRAKPETENFFTRILNQHVRNYWDASLLRVSFGVLTASFVTCVIGFFVNMSRHHRKTDRYNKAIIVLGTVTFILIIAFINKLV